MARVKGVRGMREGLAEVLEDDIPNCTALELLRSFAGHKYVTCKQVRRPALTCTDIQTLAAESLCVVNVPKSPQHFSVK
jgi:hypothetical protein